MTRLRRALSDLLSLPGVGRVMRSVPCNGTLLCLAYHRIGVANGSMSDHGLWSASPESFERQVCYLKQHADIIAPGDLTTALGRRRGRYVIITFDDGYLDNYTTAFPILKSHGARATFFVTTGFLDTGKLSWWDEIAWMVKTSSRQTLSIKPWIDNALMLSGACREKCVRELVRAYKQLPGSQCGAYLDSIADAAGTGRLRFGQEKSPWMTWEMVREMKSYGMCIGGHTVDHPVLSQMTMEQQQEQIHGCSRRISAELNGPMRWFSYPVGGRGAFSAETRACLANAGVETAFSYYGGTTTITNFDRFDVRRTAIETDTTFPMFSALVAAPRYFA